MMTAHGFATQAEEDEFMGYPATQVAMAPAPVDIANSAVIEREPVVNPAPQPGPASPRDIFSEGVDPSQFMLSPEQEKARAEKQSQVAIFQALSNQFANHANQWKPGSVDQGANAALFKGYQGQIDEPLHALERKKSAFQSAENVEQRRLTNESVKAKMDPTSNVSAGLRLHVAQKARQMAQLPVLDEATKAGLLATAERYENGQQTALESERESAGLDKALGPQLSIYRSKSIENQGKDKLAFDEKKLGETARASKAREALDRMKLNLEERKLASADAKHDSVHITKPQEKVNEFVSKMDARLADLRDIKQLKAKVDTGPWEAFKGKVTDVLDITDQERMDLRAAVGTVFNEILHELSGAAISDTEMSRLSTQIPQESDQDGPFMAKISRALVEAEKLKQLAIKRYQTTGGKMHDSSDTSREATGQAPQLPGAKVATPKAASSYTPEQLQLYKEAITDPDAPAPVKSKAQELKKQGVI